MKLSSTQAHLIGLLNEPELILKKLPKRLSIPLSEQSVITLDNQPVVLEKQMLLGSGELSQS